MKKRFTIEELCCAHCAAKMEDGIRALPGVQTAAVNFLTQKLTVEAPDEQFESIMDEVVALCRKIEPDCVILR